MVFAVLLYLLRKISLGHEFWVVTPPLLDDPKKN